MPIIYERSARNSGEASNLFNCATGPGKRLASVIWTLRFSLTVLKDWPVFSAESNVG